MICDLGYELQGQVEMLDLFYLYWCENFFTQCTL